MMQKWAVFCLISKYSLNIDFLCILFMNCEWVWEVNIHMYLPVPTQHLDYQPSKLKFLLGCHLATNSFGLGRLFYKSSRQLQNFRCHGNQNGHNLEGWLYPYLPRSIYLSALKISSSIP